MEKEKKHIGIKIFCILIILSVITYLYARYLNPYWLKTYEIPIYNENLNSAYNGFKIAQFSDLHYGRTTDEETLKKVTKELNNLNADIIIFTGDLFDSKPTDEETKILTKYLKKINTNLAKFAIIGDYDSKYLTTYTKILEESNFTLLDNSSKLIYNKSTTPLNFIGLTNTKDIDELYNNDYFNITLIHEPDLIKDLTNTQIVFAGHSLGGQIKIPFYGGIRKIDGASTYFESFYQVNDISLYISNGLGTQDYSLRFFNTPSITLYRLYNS